MVGNADNSPMVNISGVAGAGPIWNQFMSTAHAGEPVLSFTPPTGVRQVEGLRRHGHAAQRRLPGRAHWFAEDRPCRCPGNRICGGASAWCVARRGHGIHPADQVEERVFKVYRFGTPPWAIQHGIAQPPIGALVAPPTPQPGEVQVAITSPADGATVTGVLPVYGKGAAIPGFAAYELQYGISHDPGAFSPPISGLRASVTNGQLGTWDTTGLGNGPHTLRVLVRAANGAQYEGACVFASTIRRPTATPEPTPTWTVEPPTPTL